MNILCVGLGFREIHRLCSFVNLLIDSKHASQCINGVFGYDIHFDEPYLVDYGDRKLYASDFDIAFESGYDAVFVPDTDEPEPDFPSWMIPD